LPKAIDMMRRREEEILGAIKHLSEKTKDFSKPEMMVIGGYALRAFIPFSRFTRDCDFAVKKRNGWNIDFLKDILPDGFSIEHEEKRGSYAFMRCIKFLRHEKSRIKVSIDFMEGEIRGRDERDAVIIDEKMIDKRKFVELTIGGEKVEIPVPCYTDYFIMKVVSCRASDIRDIAAMILEKGIPESLDERLREVLPHPEIFNGKINRIISEIRRKTFLDSWRGIFGTKKYSEKDREKVLEILNEYWVNYSLKEINQFYS